MSQVAIDGYCPVAYFLAGRPLKGNAEFTSAHAGKIYHLSSAGAKVAFDAEPAQFVPAFDGACAFGMSISEAFPVDPTNYKIVGGRLFLFLRNDLIDGLQLWNDGNEARSIAAAETYFST